MTKAELIKVLDTFSDDQYVAVLLHNEYGKSQLVIQSVEPYKPWHGGLEDKSNWLIGINVHSQNSEIKK